jgi:hypothetical protein
MGSANEGFQTDQIANTDLPFAVLKYDSASKIFWKDGDKTISLIYSSVTARIFILGYAYVGSTITSIGGEKSIIKVVKNRTSIRRQDTTYIVDSTDHSKIFNDELELILQCAKIESKV